jgi:hypothetical protein
MVCMQALTGFSSLLLFTQKDNYLQMLNIIPYGISFFIHNL